jgi:hypothetical protein
VRLRGLPTGAVAALTALTTACLALGIGLVIALNRAQPSTLVAGPTSNSAGATATATVTVTATPSPTTTQKPTPVATHAPSRPAIIRPGGTARVVTYGANYGQGFPEGSCSSWLVRVDNQTNQDLTGMTYRAASAGFDNPSFDSKPAIRPPAVHLRLSIPAHLSQDVPFHSCSPSHVPRGYDDYEEIPPTSVTLSWIRGYRQTTCFGLSC